MTGQDNSVNGKTICSSRALRRALACLLLKAGDECAQRRLSRLAARCTRRGYGQARIDLGEAAASLDVLAPPDDAIGERNARRATHEFAHLEARSALTAHIESAAVALGRGEYTIIAALDHLG